MTEAEYCPITEATKLVGDHWNILIVRQLLDGCKRFNQIQESINGITNATLSQRLKLLAEAEIVTRKQYDCIPPKVEYTLTSKGQDLEKMVSDIEVFARKYY